MCDKEKIELLEKFANYMYCKYITYLEKLIE